MNHTDRHFKTSSTMWAGQDFVNCACGESVGSTHILWTRDPSKVDCPDCIKEMYQYEKNMMLSLLMQDFGTNNCANRFTPRCELC